MNVESTPVILIADADRVSRERLALFLMQNGFEVECVASGREAINTVCKCDVSVAIIDTHLSDIDGHKIVPILKDMNRKLRVVVTTAEHTDDLEACVRQSEIVYYALKSEGFQHVLDAVRTAAASRQRERSELRAV